MRKLTLKIKSDIVSKLGLTEFFSKIEKLEIEELLKLDYSNGIEVAIVKITLKQGVEFDDLNWSKYILLVDLIGQNNNVYTILLKTVIPKPLRKFTKKFDIDLIWDKPTYFVGEEFVFSCIAGEETLQKFIKAAKSIGTIKGISYNLADYRGRNMLAFLTKKQRAIFNAAKSKGYYKYPRKINATNLAKELGISKPTLIEHLRRTENKIIQNINA